MDKMKLEYHSVDVARCWTNFFFTYILFIYHKKKK